MTTTTLKPVRTDNNTIDSALFLSAPNKWGDVILAMKPGAHLLLISPIKDHHTHTIRAEDSGLEIRDTIAYVFTDSENDVGMMLVTVARKPLDGTVAENTLRYGTGGINVDGCRVELKDGDNKSARYGHEGKRSTAKILSATPLMHSTPDGKGRWPANLILQDCPTVREMFPSPHGAGHPNYRKTGGDYNASSYNLQERELFRYGDSGSAARFFYSAPCLNDLLAYLLKLVTPPNGTVLTNCNTDNLPEEYNYVTDFGL